MVEELARCIESGGTRVFELVSDGCAGEEVVSEVSRVVFGDVSFLVL